MSHYTTGELARLCGVTVRTVQYYDARNILTPSALSEGGRRLYSQEDAKKLKAICFLRELDMPIKAIGQLFEEEDPASVIDLLLEQQQQALSHQARETQEKLRRLEELRRGLKTVKHFSLESVGDIARKMKNRKKLHRMYALMIALGLVMDALQIWALILWIRTGQWLPFAIGLPIVIGLCIYLSRYYLSRVSYICPQCHTLFDPVFKEAFWANHTPTTRKLTCPHCGHKGFCVEVYREKKAGQ